MEYLLTWYSESLQSGQQLTEEDHRWRPARLATAIADIGIVHFSGNVKLWHYFLDSNKPIDNCRAVEHTPSNWADVGAFAEHLLRSCCEGYNRWVTRNAPPEDYAYYGCTLLADGHLELRDGNNVLDITGIVDEMVQRLREVTILATECWKGTLERLLIGKPGGIREFEVPTVCSGRFAPSARVKVFWPPEAAAKYWILPGLWTRWFSVFGKSRYWPPAEAAVVEEESEGAVGRWLLAMVVSVHKDGCYVVRFDCGGSWGVTERRAQPHLCRPA